MSNVTRIDKLAASIASETGYSLSEAKKFLAAAPKRASKAEPDANDTDDGQDVVALAKSVGLYGFGPEQTFKPAPE